MGGPVHKVARDVALGDWILTNKGFGRDLQEPHLVEGIYDEQDRMGRWRKILKLFHPWSQRHVRKSFAPYAPVRLVPRPTDPDAIYWMGIYEAGQC